MGTPNEANDKKPNPSYPARSNCPCTIKLGGVAMSVNMPLMSAAMLSGIMSRPGGTLAWRAMRSTAGIKIATTPVELITMPRTATTSINKTMSRFSLLPRGAPSRRRAFRDAGADEPFSDDEQSGDENDIGVTEAGQCFIDGNDAEKGQQRQHEESDNVHPRLVDGEHNDGRRQHHQHDCKVIVHRCVRISMRLSFHPQIVGQRKYPSVKATQ